MGDIAKSVRSLLIPSPTRTPLIPKAPQGAQPAVVGRGRTPAAGSGGGGVLIETTFASRTYWANETITSTDGAFTWIVKPVRRVSLQGGDWIDFADPTP